MTRKVCVVTGSRAEYGLLRWVMQGVRETEGMELQLIVTGAHLAPEFGLTFRDIERDGFSIDRKVDIQLGADSPAALGRSMGLAMIGCAEALEKLRPDLLVVLGDRYEILAVVAAALLARIPVAHLNGGEASEGAYDEAIRHAITKMAHLHFVAAPAYQRRVIQLGEAPDRVFVVGTTGIDSMKRLQLLNRADLESALGFNLERKNLLITFHPATLEDAPSRLAIAELLAALSPLRDTRLIFTRPNADAETHDLWRLVEEFVEAHANARAVTSLGQLRYLSCLAQVDGVVGNSSSGLLEVPSFKKGTINIGERQRGRLRADSVIDCAADRNAIAEAIRRLYSAEFQGILAAVTSPFGEGGASERIVEIIRTHPLEGLVRKAFHDIPVAPTASREVA